MVFFVLTILEEYPSFLPVDDGRLSSWWALGGLWIAARKIPLCGATGAGVLG